MTYESLFSAVGLSSKESKIYEMLLRKGASTAPSLVKELGEKRGVVHFLLNSLVEKGLVGRQKDKNGVVFSPEHPSKLQELLVQKEKELDNTKESLFATLPHLTSEYNLSTNKPGVYYFEGIEGIKKVYEDTLKENKPINAVLQTENVEPQLLKWLTGPYVHRRVQLKIPVKAIVSSDKDEPEYVRVDKRELRESKVVPRKKFSFALEISIYADKVAFMGHNKEAGLTAVIIENPKIAMTMKAWFDLTWQKL